MNRSLFAALAASALLLLSACASTPDMIVGAPVATASAAGAPLELVPPAGLPVGPVLARDLVSAAFNLDEAVRIGALPAADPAPKCIHDVLTQAGVEGSGATDRQSFTPKKDGIASAGAIAYILVQQAKTQANRSVTVSPECLQLIGQIQLDALRLAGRVGAAALPAAISGGVVGDLKSIANGATLLRGMGAKP